MNLWSNVSTLEYKASVDRNWGILIHMDIYYKFPNIGSRFRYTFLYQKKGHKVDSRSTRSGEQDCRLRKSPFESAYPQLEHATGAAVAAAEEVACRISGLPVQKNIFASK